MNAAFKPGVLYIDTDHKAGSGKTEALCGRHVTFPTESAWEYAIWVEGWDQKIFTADGKEVQAAIRVSQDPVNKITSIRIPKAALGDPQPGWFATPRPAAHPISDSVKVTAENNFPLDIWDKAEYYKVVEGGSDSLYVEITKKLAFCDETKVGALYNTSDRKLVLKLTIDF